MSGYSHDLIILTADGNMQSAVEAILQRLVTRGALKVSFKIFSHLHHDPGCLRKAHTFLLPYTTNFKHSLVIFDRDGCGKESKSREELEAEVEHRLSINGWHDRSAAIVIDPELEVWLWTDSNELDQVLGWSGRQPDLRTWLVQKGFLASTSAKPADPKGAYKSAIREVRMPKSPSHMIRLAQRVSLQRCTDSAFDKFLSTLKKWFP